MKDYRYAEEYKPTRVELAAAVAFQPYFASVRNPDYYLSKFEGTEQVDEIAGVLAYLRLCCLDTLRIRQEQGLDDTEIFAATAGVKCTIEEEVEDYRTINYDIVGVTDYDYFD